jgi:DNA recombination protein RmuC
MPEQNVLIFISIITLIVILALVWVVSRLRSMRADAQRQQELLVQIQNNLREELSNTREIQISRIAELQQNLGERFAGLQNNIERRLGEMSDQQGERFARFSDSTQNTLHQHRQSFEERQMETLKLQQDSLTQGMAEIRKQVNEALGRYGDELGKRMESLTKTTDQRLQDISGQVEKRLSDGFEKTTATFADVLKRLALIDEAQKKITELSGNVVSLQEVLADKRSRGAFGEVQLSALVSNVMPENSFQFQYGLPNGMRVDCMLFLPEPSGHIAIDSKFPLESYRRITDIHLPDSERQAAERQFRQDIRKHIKDIAGKYIIPGETSDGAVMFIPAESVFAEIHAHYYELVEEAQKSRVWMVSPTTLMAVLTTARAVLKDSATRKQVHIIQDHLIALSRDFERFQKRMDALSSHINQAQKDVEQVNTSARKISSRFEKIEQVDLPQDDAPHLLDHESGDKS